MKPRMKTKLVLTGVSLILALSFAAAQQADETPEVLLERAIQLETVDGDLQAAIEQYKKIIAGNGDKQSVAAKALLRLGGCYEKLGREEAQKTYQKLIADYPEQMQEVTAARQRLAALSKTSDADKKPVFTTRQILAGFRGSRNTSLSPDGRYISLGKNDDLHIRDLETGVIRRLTNEGDGGDPMSAKWSPDGKHMAFIWDTGTYEDLRVISAEGGKSRILADFNKASVMQVFDWSPDRKNILIWLETKGTRQIVLVSAEDGATTILKTFDGRGDWPQVMRFSRDGLYIAYDYPQEKGVLERDIFVISTDGKRELPLVQHPADDRLLGWPPNSEAILFASDRHGSLDMWLQMVSGGKAQGSPALVKKGADQIVPLGFTQSGAFYYAQQANGRDVHSARIDSRSGKVLAPAEVIIKRNEGRNTWPDYSPDGKYLAYLTTQSRSLGNPLSPNLNILCIRSLDSGKEREFNTRFKQLIETQWSPDGQSLFLTAWDDQGGGIYRVNAQTGKFTLIVRNNLLYNSHRVTPDGKTIIYLRSRGTSGQLLIIARNLITGKEKQLYSGWFPSFSISPDGQWLALISGSNKKILQVMSLSGGWVKDLLQIEGDILFYPSTIEWTADGKYILYQRPHPAKDGGPLILWQIAVDGGEAQKLNLPMAWYSGLSAHPDGQHLVFGSLSSRLKTTAGIWVMESFLPPDVSASK